MKLLNKVYLGLGSNLGDRLNYIKEAISELIKHCIIIKKIASIYETHPYGVFDQPLFLNTVVEIDTEMDVFQLLTIIKGIEQSIGRIKRKHWREREIDIDILLFNDEIYDFENLCVPHIDLLNRDFVVIPLMEINGEIIDPNSGRAIKDIWIKSNNIINKYREQLLFDFGDKVIVRPRD